MSLWLLSYYLLSQEREKLNPNINIEEQFDKRGKTTLMQKYSDLRRNFQDAYDKYTRSGNNDVASFVNFTNLISVQYLWCAMQFYNCHSFVERTICRVVNAGRGQTKSLPTQQSTETDWRPKKRRKKERGVLNSLSLSPNSRLYSAII